METLWLDLRHALRTFAKTPGFTLIAVLTLALGIGANTAIFTVLDAVLLRSLPVSHPEELVVLTDPDAHGSNFGSESGKRSLLAYSEFEYIRDHNDVFSQIFAADSSLPTPEVSIADSSPNAGAGKETASVRLVSGDYFATLGVKPELGRAFTPEVDRARGASPIAVISHAFWRQRFGLNPAILGKTVQIHRTSFEIIGVAPPGFFGETVGDAADIWIPMMMQDAVYPGQDLLTASPQGVINQHTWIQVMGRLKPGTTYLQAKASINVVFQRMLESETPSTLTAEQRKSRLDQSINLQPGARGSSTLRESFGTPLKYLLVLVGLVLLIACANVANLLLAAGLFASSLSKLAEVNLGYNREHLLLFRVDAAAAGCQGAAATRLYQQLLQRLSTIPGVGGVTVSKNGLFSGSESGDPIAVEGYAPKQQEELHSRMDHVGPRYFSVLGIPILLGREIEPQDSGNGPRAAVINQTFARRFFPNGNPLGKQVRDTYPGNPADMVVVGVVSDAKYNSLREQTPPRIYAPLFNPMWELSNAVYEVRTFADPSSVSASLRQAVQATNPSIPPLEIRAMSGLVDGSLQTDRFLKQLSEAFAALAMLLASIGLYGIMAYTVARSTRDIGIRLALGAGPGIILWQVLRETLVLVGAGIAIGVPLALGGAFLIRNMLFGLGFADPLALLVAAISLLLVAALAGFLPARRASQVDPMVVLRYE